MTEPSRFHWAAVLRIAFGTSMGALLLACLAGILVSGPVVVRVPLFDPRVAVSADRMRETVERLCGEFAPRDPRNLERLDAAAAWIADALAGSGLEVRLQSYDLPEGRFANVVARQPGAVPGAPVFVVGAHYDAYGGFPGADDNASGVAVLLELARTLPQPAARGDRYFVAFSTEEPPFFGTDGMGSHVFARSLVDSGIDVELMISLDMVGYYSDLPGSQSFPAVGLGLLYPDRADFVAVVGDHRSGPWIKRVKTAMRATEKIEVFSLRAPPSLFPVHLSDHLPFRRLGLPAVQITDGAWLRNPHYHASADTPDTLDYDRMAALVQALHGVLWDPETPVSGEADREPH